jgi:hypothetical protein
MPCMVRRRRDITEHSGAEGSLAGSGRVRSARRVASVLKIIAGAAAGFVYQRYMAPNATGP